MINIKKKTECCGCAACYNICPVSAISMRADNEGFFYPKIGADKCINCNLCEKVCPILHNNITEEKTEGYIVRYNDEKIVEESTSGGAFSAFAIPLLEQGWLVYGAGFNENMQVICKKTDSLEGLHEMRGSKFVQSAMGMTYREIQGELAEGKKILFSGTPCQISGLLNYLGKKYKENLICIDFVCRGVPSPGLWKNYVSMMEKKYNSKMINAKFKNKTYGYHTSTMKIEFANGKTYYASGRVDPYMKAFVKELSSRPSCSSCAFKGIERRSDITIFDCYEYTKITGNVDDDKGYSSLLVHTEKGQELLKMCEGSLICGSENINNIVTENGIMVKYSAKPNPKREEFYGYILEMSIDKAINRVEPITDKDRIVEKLKFFLKKAGLINAARKLKKKEKVDINPTS